MAFAASFKAVVRDRIRSRRNAHLQFTAAHAVWLMQFVALLPTGENMHGFEGERILMRIHIGERDKFEGKPLYQAIVELLRSRRYAGATVQRGIMGFGATAHVHSDSFVELSLDLPIIVECVETEEKIQAVLPELDNMLGGGLITLERAKVIMYRTDLPPDARAGDSSINANGAA